MGNIVLFGSQKGGVGKSTLTSLAATAFSQEPFNYKVVVIDCDPQKSLLDARNHDLKKHPKLKPSFDILDYNAAQTLKALPNLDQRYDLIFIDVAGKLDINLPSKSQEITPMLLNTDLLVVPFTAGNYGLDSTLRYLDFVLDIAEMKREMPRPLAIIGFINMLINRWKDDKQLVETVQDIASETGLRFMANNLGFYTAFRGSDTIHSLYDEQSTDAAAINLKKWINELHKIIANV
jgi:chromosome partitioning protein